MIYEIVSAYQQIKQNVMQLLFHASFLLSIHLPFDRSCPFVLYSNSELFHSCHTACETQTISRQSIVREQDFPGRHLFNSCHSVKTLLSLNSHSALKTSLHHNNSRFSQSFPSAEEENEVIKLYEHVQTQMILETTHINIYFTYTLAK